MELDHVGFAVRSLPAALKVFEPLFGVSGSAPELVAGQKVRVSFLEVGPSHVELLEPTEADSAVGRFIEKRGEGMHHVAFRVPSVDAQLREVESRGGKLIDRVGRPGARGRKVGFVHPAAANGVLVEFVEGS